MFMFMCCIQPWDDNRMFVAQLRNGDLAITKFFQHGRSVSQSDTPVLHTFDTFRTGQNLYILSPYFVHCAKSVSISSMMMPSFDQNNELFYVHDSTGWWNLYRVTRRGFELNLTPETQEVGWPVWK